MTQPLFNASMCQDLSFLAARTRERQDKMRTQKDLPSVPYTCTMLADIRAVEEGAAHRKAMIKQQTGAGMVLSRRLTPPPIVPSLLASGPTIVLNPHAAAAATSSSSSSGPHPLLSFAQPAAGTGLAYSYGINSPTWAPGPGATVPMDPISSDANVSGPAGSVPAARAASMNVPVSEPQESVAIDAPLLYDAQTVSDNSSDCRNSFQPALASTTRPPVPLGGIASPAPAPTSTLNPASSSLSSSSSSAASTKAPQTTAWQPMGSTLLSNKQMEQMVEERQRNQQGQESL